MDRILAIVRKDARHLWPAIALVSALMLLAAALDPTYTRHPSSLYEFLPLFLLPMACWTLIVAAIHEERLPGHRQYWLTRPYSWKEMLAAKALFVAAFVNLPLLAYHTGVCLAVGVPLFEHLPALLWRQVFFTALYVLPPAAVAAITRNFGEVVATALLAFLLLWFSQTLFMLLTHYQLIPWQNATGPMDAVLAALLATGAAGILVFQYSRRRTALARCLTAALAVLAAIAIGYPGFRVHRPAGVRSTARLLLDPTPDRRSTVLPAGRPEIATLDIPVRLEAIPPGVILEQQRMAVSIELPGPGGVPASAAGGFDGIAGNRAWLTLFAAKELVDRTASAPATVSGSLEFRRFGSARTLPLPKGRPVPVPGVGVCRDSLEAEGWISFACFSPSPRASLFVGNSLNPVNWIIPQGFVESSVPTASGFQPLVRFTSQVSYRNWQQIGASHLLVAQPLPPVRIDFRLSGIRLTDYLVDRERRPPR